MVFQILQPWTKVAHPVSAGADLEFDHASMWLPTSASALPEDHGVSSSDGWLPAVPCWWLAPWLQCYPWRQGTTVQRRVKSKSTWRALLLTCAALGARIHSRVLKRIGTCTLQGPGCALSGKVNVAPSTCLLSGALWHYHPIGCCGKLYPVVPRDPGYLATESLELVRDVQHLFLCVEVFGWLRDALLRDAQGLNLGLNRIVRGQ